MEELPVIPGLQLHPTDGNRLQVHFSYHPDNVARIRTIPGRRWHPEEKCWSIPRTRDALVRLRQLFTADPIRSYPPPLRAATDSKQRWDRLSPEEQAFIAPVEEELKLRGYSPPTRKSYKHHLLSFCRFLAESYVYTLG